MTLPRIGQNFWKLQLSRQNFHKLVSGGLAKRMFGRAEFSKIRGKLDFVEIPSHVQFPILRGVIKGMPGVTGVIIGSGLRELGKFEISPFYAQLAGKVETVNLRPKHQAQAICSEFGT